MPYDYRTVLDQYDMLHDAGIVSEPLEKWSARKNRETGTDAYSAGLEDDWIKRSSVAIDRVLEASGLPGLGEKFGGWVGGAIGAEEEGAKIGKNLPRMAVNFAPMALSATPLAPLGLAATAGLSGAEAYTSTGSPASGLIAAGTNVIMPGVGNLARNYALKKLGAEAIEGQVIGGVDKLIRAASGESDVVTKGLVEKLGQGIMPKMVSEYVPKNLGQGLAAYGAEQAAGSLVGAGGGIAESYFSGTPYEFSPTTELLNMTLGQLPFAALSATKHGRVQFGGRAARQHEAELRTSIDLSEKAIEQHRLNEEETAKAPIEEVPETPEEVAAREQRITKITDLRERQRAAKADGTTVAENDRQKWAAEDNSLLAEQGALPGHIFGVPKDSIPKQTTVYPKLYHGGDLPSIRKGGFKEMEGSAGHYFTPDIEEARGFNEQLGIFEEPLAANVKLEKPFVTRNPNESYYLKPERKAELISKGYDGIILEKSDGSIQEVAAFHPKQIHPLEDPAIKLQTAEQRLAAAKDNVDLQDSIVEINEVREKYGLAPLDDEIISGRQRQFDLGTDRDAIQSHIDETRRLATAKEEGKLLNTEIALKESELTHADPAVRAMAMVRLNDIRTEDLTSDNLRHVANAPMNRDNAPMKGFANEHALRITESVPETTPGDQQKFLDYVDGGVLKLMQKHGMTKETAGIFLNDNPRVLSWMNRMEHQLKDGLTVNDYSDRYLRNMGVNETEAKRQAAIVSQLSEKPDVTANLLAVPTESAETKKALAGMNELLASDPEPTTKIFAEKEVTNADELYNHFVRTGDVDADSLDVLDGKVLDYVYAKAREHKQLADVMKSVEDTPRVNSSVESPDSVLGPLRKLAAAEAKRAQDAADLSAAAGAAPKTYLENLLADSWAPSAIGKRAVKDPRTWGFIADPLDTTLGAWQRIKDVWKTPAWLARISPHMAEFVSKGHQLSPNIHKMSMEAFKAFGMDENGKFSKDFIKAVQDKQTTAALSKWMAINNRRGKDSGVTVIRPDDPEVARLLQGLTEDKQAKVKELMARNVISTKTMFKQELDKMLQMYSVEGTEFLGPRTGFKYDQNLKLSKDMLDVLNTDWNDQAQAAKAQDTMMNLQVSLAEKPGVYTDLYKTMGERMLEYTKRKEFFDANPAWNTAKRYGKWDFVYRKGNKRIQDSVDSRSEALEIAGGNEIISIVRNTDNDNTPVPYDREIPTEMADARWFSNHITWLNKNATYWSRALFRAQSRAMLADPELGPRPDIQRLAKQHTDNMLSADPKFGMFANKVASTWFLGYNAASAMANGTQLIVRGAAEMSKLTGNPIQSYKRIIGAYKEMFNPAGMSKEHQTVVKRLEKDGITTDITESFVTGAEDNGVELKRVLSGKSPLKNPASNLARVYANVGMHMFRRVERVNNQGAVLAAYDYYRGQKDAFGRQLSHEDAYQKALVFNRSVNDTGGKANRPIDIVSGTGPVSKSLGLMATSLQTYNIGSINQIASYIKNGFFDQPGMTPAEKWKHKIALTHLLGAQATLAGALGMPFMGTAIALIDQVFPAAETGKHMRDFVNGIIPTFLRDDEDDGGVIADMAMTGVPSMFGWDMQSRLSMGSPVAGISEINGFQPELLFGTPSSLVTKFISGGIDMAQGDTRFVGNMMPPALKKMTDVAFGDGKVRDYNGKPVLDQPSPGERVGMFLGFKPTRVSAFDQANRMKNRAEQIHRDQDHHFNVKQAEEIIQGRFDLVKTALKEKMTEAAESGREYDWVKGGYKIADAAVERHFTRDMTRELSPRDARIAKMFPISPVKASEVERRKFRAWVLHNLGIPYKPRDDAKYALMDQIKEQYPSATRTELMRMAEKAMGRAKTLPALE
jgi:hypothetical protein